MSTELIKITINGKECEVEKGARLIEACRDNGHFVPSFCYYSDLELQASCRMCLVRIEKMPKLQASCTISCTDGMVVTTDSEEIIKTQRAMSEFLLTNHPLDCPVCDRGGECELQEMVFDSGNLEERFSEKKNALPEKFLSPIVANDPQRCIVCKRCTRVCAEWMGEDAIEAGNRGANTVIGTYGGWLDCSQCGNCIEVCPTGTLLDGVYRHETRPWELEHTVSTCTYCSDGCQLSVGSRGGEVRRIVARDRHVNGINGEFLCIKGRFAHGFVNSGERVKTPLIRYKKDGKHIPSTWDEAIKYVAAKFADVGNTGVIASSRLTNESIFTLKRFAAEVSKSGNYALEDGFDLSPVFENLSTKLATHADIRKAKTIALLGGDVDEDQPFTAKQIRQAVRNGGAKLIIANERPVRLSKRAAKFLHIGKGTIDALVLALADAAQAETSAKKLGVDASDIKAVREIIESTEGSVVFVFGGDLSNEALAVAAQLPTKFAGKDCLLHPLAAYSNSVGGYDMTAGRKSVSEVANASKSLLIGGSVSDTSILANKEFIVVQELFMTETALAADVVFPAASFAEQDGTYTNNDGFVQRVRQSIDLVNQAKPDWMIASQVAKEMGVDFGYVYSASFVFGALAEAVPAYKGLRYPLLKDESKPIQAAHSVVGAKDIAKEIRSLADAVGKFSDSPVKDTSEPKVGHKLHKLTMLTSKTEQFRLLAAGNPKPANLNVSPLKQIDLDGSTKTASAA